MTSRLLVMYISSAIKKCWYTNLLSEVEKIRHSQWHTDAHQLHKLNTGDATCNDPLFTWKRVIPKDYRVEVSERNPDNLLRAALAVFKTYKWISEIFYWPHLRSDAARYIHECTTSHITKPEQRRLTPFMFSRRFMTPRVRKTRSTFPSVCLSVCLSSAGMFLQQQQKIF